MVLLILVCRIRDHPGVSDSGHHDFCRAVHHILDVGVGVAVGQPGYLRYERGGDKEREAFSFP